MNHLKELSDAVGISCIRNLDVQKVENRVIEWQVKSPYGIFHGPAVGTEHRGEIISGFGQRALSIYHFLLVWNQPLTADLIPIMRCNCSLTSRTNSQWRVC